VANRAYVGAGADIDTNGLVVKAIWQGMKIHYDLSKVSLTRDSINLGDDHGVQTGDKIVYE
jgi:hypothetical protein